MSVHDITPDAILGAVLEGHDDVLKLAEHFTVLPTSHTLRSTITALVEADRLVIVCPHGDRSSAAGQLAVA